MNIRRRVGVGVTLLVLLVGSVAFSLRHADFQVLNPKGSVAHSERGLIIFTVLLGLGVLIPVFTMTFMIAWKYREGNTKAKYRPDWDHNVFAETLWWGIPSAIIVLLSVVTWTTSHSLDPHKELAGGTPMHIQVVALDWKWLFIYPEQGVASVNYVQFPVNRPVDFEITSNGVMNSFWIPQLGSQIYAMAGMTTQLNLVADTMGDYQGSSANLSGKGFAGMKFTARATSAADFNAWAGGLRRSAPALNSNTYKALARPSENNAAAYYGLGAPDLYNRILLSFQLPGNGE